MTVQDKSIEDVAKGVEFFIEEATLRMGRPPTSAAVSGYYSHLISDRVAISHPERLRSEVKVFVEHCLRAEMRDPRLREFRESIGRGITKEHVKLAREICPNEPGCE